MRKKSTISDKLKIYSAIAAGLLTTGKEANASIVYTDINPDASKGVNSDYNVDFNNDGNIDVRIMQRTDIYGMVTLAASGITNGTKIAGYPSTGSGGTTIAAKLDFGSSIDPSILYTNGGSGYMSLINGTFTAYPWTGGATDKYVGAKFIIGSNTHYGWILVSTGSDSKSFVVKSYAYENVPSTGISAGATVSASPAPIAGSVTATDIANNNNASDISVSWTKPADETGIFRYRVFVVPAEYAASFDVTAAKEVSSERYTQIDPTGDDHSFELTSNLLTTQGLPVSNGKSYKLFVMSVASPGYVDALSQASNSLTLSKPAETVTEVTGYDSGDNNNASDLTVTFYKPLDDSGIKGYKIFVVPREDAETFDLTMALSVGSDSYFSYGYQDVEIPTESTIPSFARAFNTRSLPNPVSITLPANIKSTDGNAISIGKEYRIFVLSEGNGTDYISSLSSQSNYVMLQLTAETVTDILASDVSDNNNASDIEVTFNKVADESTVVAYRIFVVPASQAEGFTLKSAQTSSSDRYQTVDPDGNNPKVKLSADLLDSEGNPINSATSYAIIVMSAGNTGYIDNLAYPDNLFSLSSPASQVSNITVSVTGSTAGDIAVNFDRSSEVTGVKSYRIFVLSADNAGHFDLAEAVEVSDGNYYEITDLEGDMPVRLPVDLRSVYGDDIIYGTMYKVFVMSVGDEGYTNSLSKASESFMLDEATGIAKGSVLPSSDIFVFGNELMVRNMPENGTLEIFDLSGARLGNANLEKGDNVFNVSDVKSLFLVSITSNGKTQSKKLSK